MKNTDKTDALSLGIRISTVFLFAVVLVVIVAYYVLSQNFHTLLKNYTIQLMQSMSAQGVDMVESELENSRRQVELLASMVKLPEDDTQQMEFPKVFDKDTQLRMVCVTPEQTIASDGRARDIRRRQDIQSALAGTPALYGPYYNEEDEFVVCYSAPIKQDNQVVGALSIEEDGYLFCDLIRNMQFVNSGESYIINAEGTDIAVSDPEHISWVTTQYNATALYRQTADEETYSIIQLEQNGLAGKSGMGTYYWENGLCYLFYEPIQSTGWVLLTGIREEEIAAMTQSTLFASISKGPTLVICLVIFVVLTALIIFWIIASTKKNDEINKKLEIIANHDSLTGLLNRRYLETELTQLWQYPVMAPSQAAVFMLDVDNFKQYNDFYGHPQGDDCLRCIAALFQDAFEGRNGKVLRYGGEEFIALAFEIDEQSARQLGEKICQLVRDENIPNPQNKPVTVSVGICYVKSTLVAALSDCIKTADTALYQAKNSGKDKAVLLEIQADA